MTSNEKGRSGEYQVPRAATQRAREEKAFFARLRSALDVAGMTQSELARRLDCNPSTVTEWFQRGSMPKGHLMLHLPRVLKVDANWLLSGEGSPYGRPGGTPVRKGDRAAQLHAAYEVLAKVEKSFEEIKSSLTAEEQPPIEE